MGGRGVNIDVSEGKEGGHRGDSWSSSVRSKGLMMATELEVLMISSLLRMGVYVTTSLI